MAPNFLELPREIRDQICAYILVPTGRVILRPTTHGETSFWPFPMKFPASGIDMKILYTCKQMHHECKDIFWKGSIVRIEAELMLLDPDFMGQSQRLICDDVQRLEIKLPVCWDDLETIMSDLDVWSRYKNLREIIITAPGIGTMTEFGKVVRSRRNEVDITNEGDSIDGNSSSRTERALFQMLRLASRQDRESPRVRTLDLHIGMQHLSRPTRRVWFERQPPKECEDTLRAMHDTLGGELLVDGILCYKDGVLLQERFKGWESETKEIQPTHYSEGNMPGGGSQETHDTSALSQGGGLGQ